MAWMMCLLAADEVAAALTVQKEWNGDCIGSELKIAECPQQLSWDGPYGRFLTSASQRHAEC